jgi:hypothetical protein
MGENEQRVVPIKMNKEEVVNFEEDQAADIIGKNLYVRIWMAFVWLFVTAVMCKFIYDITTQYLDKTPSSSISFNDETSLAVPKVVVCNWNQDGSAQNATPSHNCPECLLTLELCINWNTSGDCSSLWVHTPIETKAGLFDCYTYNGDNQHALFSSTTGYSGAISTIWTIQLFGETLPPTNRAGAQVSMFFLDPTLRNDTDPQAIYDEVRFAGVGFDNFYAMQMIQTIHNEKYRAYGVEANTTFYSTFNSEVNLLTTPNDTIGFIGVSFAFQTLSQQVNTYFTAYTLANFWGDFAGMIGTLMGLDAIKVASSFPIFYVAGRYKSINPVEDHFNG